MEAVGTGSYVGQVSSKGQRLFIGILLARVNSYFLASNAGRQALCQSAVKKTPAEVHTRTSLGPAEVHP